MRRTPGARIDARLAGRAPAAKTGALDSQRWRNRMTDSLPDRLSTNPNSPYYDEEILKRGIGIRFKGQEKTNVDEYCVSEGWIRVAAGNSRDRKGNPLTILLKGPVEPYFRDEN